jgi:uncharacterized protein YndB with AHSA1/START domain
MKWALWILGGIAAIIAVITLIGMALPRDHTASRSAKLKASPDSVWAVLADTKSYPAWRSDVKKVDELPAANGKRSWTETGKSGSITFVAEEEQKPAKLVTRIANENLPFGGTWTYSLVPEDSGTRITIAENGWVSNPVFRFVSHFVLGETATMDSFLRALEKRLGENVTPVTAQ